MREDSEFCEPGVEEVRDEPYLDKFHSHQVRAGRAGGLARTDAKREATRRNLEKARLSRWKGREAAKEAMAEAIRKLRGSGSSGTGEQVDGRAGEVEEGRNLHDGGTGGIQQGATGDKEEG